MLRYANILPVCLLLTAMPFMFGAVVLTDPNTEVEKQSPADDMPSVHGPVLVLPTGPELVEQSPAVLDQPIKPSGVVDRQPAADKKPAAKKPSAHKTAEKKAGVKAEAPAKKTAIQAEPKPPLEPLEPLGPEMEALRNRVRQTVEYYSSRPLDTKNNTADHILKACLAFGCDTVVRQGGASGEPVNGFTCLCWNYPCGGYNLLKMVDGHIAARVGYGLQSNPSEFLAVLALARVPREYPIRVGLTVRTVADLVESEKLACRSGSDLSSRLIGLSRYLPAGTVWKNGLGERWSVSRLLKEELDHAQEPSPGGGTHRLMAISYAVGRRARRGLPINGQFRRAKKYISQYHDYALALQTPNGSWHPSFFKYRGAGGSSIGRINSTGRILAWLVSSLPDEKLDDPRVVRCVAFLANTLTGRRQNSLASTSAADIAARMNAIYALKVYDRRVFRPHDKAAEEAEVLKSEQSSDDKTASTM